MKKRILGIIIALSMVIGAVNWPMLNSEAAETTFILSTATGGTSTYTIPINAYISNFQKGEEITIKGKMLSDAYFNGCIGGNVIVDGNGTWSTQYFESNNNEVVFEWTGKPEYDTIDIQLWWSSSENKEVQLILPLNITRTSGDDSEVGEQEQTTVVLSKAVDTYNIVLAKYLADFQSGEEVMIKGTLTSDAWFEIGVGGHVYRGHDENAEWKTKGYDSEDNELTITWIGKPQSDTIAIQLWHTHQESTTQEVKLSLETLEVSRNYCDISKYKANNTYPDQEGYVFAGWYEDKKCSTPIGSDIKAGNYYARFVDEDVLSIKYQLPADIANEAETTNLRLITTVDSLMFTSVGFKVDVNENEVQNVSSNKVWSEITGWCKEGGTIMYKPDDSFTNMSKYFKSYEFYGVPTSEFTEKEMVVTPYWITMDGTTVTGVERKITIDGEDK